MRAMRWLEGRPATHISVGFRAELGVAGRKHTARVGQQGAPVLGVLFCKGETHNTHQ